MFTKKIIQYIENKFTQPRLSIWRTIWINLRTLPFNKAIRFPVRVYGKIKLACLDGEIIIPDNAKINIGCNLASYVSTPPGRISLLSGSKLIFGSNVRISQGVSILVHRNATLSLGNHSTIGDLAKVICYYKITIGEYSGLTYETQTTDYGSHYTKVDEQIAPIIKEVKIGNYCWIGNRTTIMPGTVLPNRTIVAAMSLINKDYSKIIDQYSLIGGVPAKLLRKNVERIYDCQYEQQLLLRDRKSLNIY